MAGLVRQAIVGREEELAAVADALYATPLGLRALVFDGPAGIGKTTVWRAALAHARERSLSILDVRPAEAEATLGYAALGDLLDPVFDEAVVDLPAAQRLALEIALLRGEAGSARVDVRAVGLAVLGALRRLAGTSPVVVAIDDLQWIDAPSARVLAFALRRLGSDPVLLLAARRADLEGPLDLGGIVEASALTSCALGPLDPSELQQMLQLCLGRVYSRSTLRRIHETSGGNPFYALELARPLELELKESPTADHLSVPEGLASLIRRRLHGLPADARAAALVAAALAEPTARSVAETLQGLGRPHGGLDDAVSEGMLVLEGERVRFTHPLLASVAYGDSPPNERRRVHAALADVVPTTEERAKHLALAADEPDEPVAAALDQAAEAAERRGAPDEAARLAEQAWRLTPPAQSEDVHRRQVDAAIYHVAAGESARARELIGHEVSSWSPGPVRGRGLHLLGRLTASGVAAKELLERARRDAVADSSLLAGVEAGLVSVYLTDFDPAGARPHAMAALALSEGLRDPVQRAAALMDVAWTKFLLGQGPSPELVREALELEKPSVPGHLGGARMAPRMREASMLHIAADFEQARPLYVSLIDRARASGSEPALCRCLALLSELECMAGDVELAARYAAEAHLVALQAADDQLRSRASLRVALVEAHRGNVEAARRAAAEAAQLGDPSRAAWPLTFLELSLGDAQAAVDTALPLVERFKSSSVVEPMYWCALMPDLIEGLVAVGDLTKAASCLDELDWRARATGRPWGLVTAARSRALIAAAGGRLDEALAAAEEAVSEGTRLAMPLECGRNLLVRGVIQRRAKQRRAARASLEQALEAFDTLGARMWAERTRTEMRRIGGRSSSGDLTPTEQQVAMRAAAGETNREIASALFMSVKTVEANLSRIYRKLDVSSRRELAGRLGPGVEVEPAQQQTTASRQS